MLSMNAFDGVRIAGGFWTLHVPAAAIAAHPAKAYAAAGAAAAITSQPKRRRTSAATGTSVDRGTI
jgi:hypothetical protein